MITTSGTVTFGSGDYWYISPWAPNVYPYYPAIYPNAYPSTVTIVNPAIDSYNQRIADLEAENKRLRKKCRRMQQRLYSRKPL